MNDALKQVLKKQGYGIIGNNSGVKLCHWLKESLSGGRYCYKQSFYGIESHRCIQMTPAINQCTQNCLFCWRFQGFSETDLKDADEPKVVVEESIKTQRRLISGFKGNAETDQMKWREANEPRHVAISLTGEPTLYPYLGELIREYHSRGITTFLVTNGTMPNVLENLDPLPTQLYITVAAPNSQIYDKLLAPMIKDGWNRLNKTLELLPSLNTRKVIRHTLVDGWNMNYVDDYAKLDLKAEPDFIEPKAYVYVGYSRERLNMANMPSFQKIKDFSEELSARTGFEIKDYREDSRVTLLSKHKNNYKLM